jgi:muramoyltetrapeptide carboxypeptidase
MFSDKSIDGVLCIKGGYGAQRILDLIDFDMIRQNPKVFVGYSDVTALHTAINRLCGFITYHAPMAATELYDAKKLDDYTIKSYINNIFTDVKPSLANARGCELKTLCGGVAEGELTGGNLSLLASSLGTPYELDAKGKLLFIEDVDEEPYRLDRMLNQLRLAGKFNDCAGIIFGAFTDCLAEEPEKSLTISDLLNELIRPAGKPAVYDFCCGHRLPTLTLPLGAAVRFDAYKREIRVV